MSRCEVFKEPNNIYMTQPVWRILEQFCPLLISILRSSALLWTLGGQACVVYPQWPPLAPSTPLKSPSFIINTYQLHNYCSCLIRFQRQHVLFMARKGVERGLNINITLWNTQELLTRKFSVAYCNAYSQTKVIHKNRRYPQKLMFTDTVGPTDVL